MFHENGSNNPEPKDQGERAGGGFERTAEQQAPLAAGAVLDHEKRETADSPAEGEQQAENPCAQKVVPAKLVLRLPEKCENYGDNRSPGRHHQRARAPAIDERRRAE